MRGQHLFRSLPQDEKMILLPNTLHSCSGTTYDCLLWLTTAEFPDNLFFVFSRSQPVVVVGFVCLPARGTTLMAMGQDDRAMSDLNQAAKLNTSKDLYTLVRYCCTSRRDA